VKHILGAPFLASAELSSGDPSLFAKNRPENLFKGLCKGGTRAYPYALKGVVSVRPLVAMVSLTPFI
jgi:hypothetical protein